jgi:hypothetical protein
MAAPNPPRLPHTERGLSNAPVLDPDRKYGAIMACLFVKLLYLMYFCANCASDGLSFSSLSSVMPIKDERHFIRPDFSGGPPQADQKEYKKYIPALMAFSKYCDHIF